MSSTPDEVITGQTFPPGPYNFDTPPPQYTIGPLKAIFTKVGQAILDANAAILAFKEQVTVQTATGEYLDQHAKMYGVRRLTGESDADFRTRILAVLKAGKCTLAAIQTAVVNYYLSILPPTATQPTVHVFDLRSDPPDAIADGLQILDFEINVGFAYDHHLAFFLDFAYLDATTYLEPFTGFEDSLGNDLDLILENVKAAGTHPVYKQSIVWV